MTISREVQLVNHPTGMPKTTDFAVIESTLPAPQEGEVEIKNIYLSVDPAMRPRLSNGQQPLNEAMNGSAIGIVSASRDISLKEGDFVQHPFGFREHLVCAGKNVQKLIPGDLPLSVYMHALGGTGFTAWGGLLVTGELRDGENVFVSAAAGAVGSVAAQIAKIKNCYVIGSAGTDEKCEWLKEDLGLDAVINYKDGILRKHLKAAAPKGIDVYFENVGGEHLDAALPRMNVNGRIPVCGMISAYNNHGARSEGVTTLSNMIYQRITMKGFVVTDFENLRSQFLDQMSGWIKSGALKYRETIFEGIERAPEALIGLMTGENIGKALVKVS